MKTTLNTRKVLAMLPLLCVLLPAGGGFSQNRDLSDESQVKGPWAEAEAGTFVKLQLTSAAGQATRTIEVVRADGRCVTLRTSEGGKSYERPEQRMYSQQELDKWMAGKKLDDKTVTIMGKDMKCEVYEKEINLDGKKVKARAYFNRSVPGWVVRVDNESGGQFKTVLELADFKR
ncbi:MAG: hypothetical protein HZA50_09225 [Planctomycetes bacterium]|nr:hypothetical protein [Planctomycetota bacterium]